MGAEGLISDKFPGKAAAAAVHTLGSKALGQRFSKCGPWICSISITRELVRNANSWAPTQA